MSATEVQSHQQSFIVHRCKGSDQIHKIAMSMILGWSVMYGIAYHGELGLVGTLWPTLYKLKLTLYLSLGGFHGALWLSFNEPTARYVFGSLGTMHVDTAHQMVCAYCTLIMCFDDHRLVRLVDFNESYATQMAKSYALNPSRALPKCGGYAPGGHCFLNSLEASCLVLMLGHLVGVGFGVAMEPRHWWRQMHFLCAWYVLVLCTFGHVFSTTALALQQVTFLYGNLFISYTALRRQHARPVSTRTESLRQILGARVARTSCRWRGARGRRAARRSEAAARG